MQIFQKRKLHAPKDQFAHHNIKHIWNHSYAKELSVTTPKTIFMIIPSIEIVWQPFWNVVKDKIQYILTIFRVLNGDNGNIICTQFNEHENFNQNEHKPSSICILQCGKNMFAHFTHLWEVQWNHKFFSYSPLPHLPCI